MCGIVGYTGDRNMESILLVGLERLSYRGYDSSGICVISDGELSCWRKAGKIHELEDLLRGLCLKGSAGIGHTRWATHGSPVEANAHPQLSQSNKFAVVHNGIIENYAQIKSELMEEGVIFRSETDTEVIVHMIEKYYDKNLEKSVEETVSKLKGTYAIAVIAESDPDKIVVCRKGSPLIIGLGKDENYVASDINAIITHTKDVMYIEDNEIGVVTRHGVDVRAIGGKKVEKEIHHIKWDPKASDKSGYDHYMLKEIFEQPTVVRNILSKFMETDSEIKFKHISFTEKELEQVSRLIIQACGTSWHAGLIGKYLFEKYANLLSEVDISSEFRYRPMLTGGNDIVVAISQSGETADTLACMREAKAKFFRVLSFVNAKNSSIAREADSVVYMHAGQEVGVASTKNYIAQLTTLYLFSIYLSTVRSTITKIQAQEMIQSLNRIPEYIENMLGQADKIKRIAEKYYLSREFLFIGRGVNYPSALEGALKLKEISYIHATGYPAGELKHGPIALINPKLPVVCIAPSSSTYDKMVSNIQEVKARKGKILSICTEGDTQIPELSDDTIFIPEVPEELTPILVAVPLQLLAYYIALLLDCNVDQPRNLAKSVTVE